LRYHLQPFTHQESADYINHRLVVAGSHGNVKFSRRALSLIYRRSGGIPRQINLLCDRAMLSAYVHGSPVIGHTHVRLAWQELQGHTGGRLRPMARPKPRRRWRMVQALILGLTLTIGGGAWLGLNWAKVMELPGVVPEPTSELSAQAPLGSSETPVDAQVDVQFATLQATNQEASPRPARAELISDHRHESTPIAAEVSGASTQGIAEVNGLSSPGLPGEVLLRALLVEFRRDLQPPGSSAKTMLARVASGFGLEMLPVRIDLNHLKQFRVACLLEMYPSDTSAPTLLIVHAIAPGGVELTDASGEIRWLEDAALNQSWHGQAYLFHRRGFDLKQVLSRGKQNPDVLTLQQRLKELGYMQAEPSGLFDDDTAAAVRRLQRDHALQVDGSAGPATKIVLYHLVGRSFAEARQE